MAHTTNDTTNIFVGIDVSKDKLDVFVDLGPDRPKGQKHRVANDADGVAQLVKLLQPLTPALVALEATGRYQQRAALALLDAGLPVAVVNPRRVAAFARVMDHHEKTDALDAKLLAEFARRIGPDAAERPDRARLELDELLARRRQLVQMRTMELNRRQQLLGKLALKQVKQTLTLLDKQIAQVEDEIDRHIDQSDEWSKRAELYKSVPGVGEATARMLVGQLPELGRLSRGQVAKLVGVAPLARDSGKKSGKRHVFGGRAQVRTTLYMAAFVATRSNPLIQAFAKRLKAAGKPHNVVIVACIRKLLTLLNAIARSGKPWRQPTPTA
jgi:transposase